MGIIQAPTLCYSLLVVMARTISVDPVMPTERILVSFAQVVFDRMPADQESTGVLNPTSMRPLVALP